jgi:hypothetical protein
MGYNVRRLQVDNDIVFLGASFWTLLDKFNITVEVIAPFANWHYARVERHWGTLFPMA